MTLNQQKQIEVYFQDSEFILECTFLFNALEGLWEYSEENGIDLKEFSDHKDLMKLKKALLNFKADIQEVTE